MKYTIEDMNEDFDYLARKYVSFKKSLDAVDFSEDNDKFVKEYLEELNDCFNKLVLKYAICFSEDVVRKNEYYLLCLNELNDTYKTLAIMSGGFYEYE